VPGVRLVPVDDEHPATTTAIATVAVSQIFVVKLRRPPSEVELNAFA
jgi:hypothetical protein